MRDDYILSLATEIRDLHARQCEYADRLRGSQHADDRKLIDRCRPREYPNLPELEHFETVFEQHDAVQAAMKDPAVAKRTKRVQNVVWVLVFIPCLLVQLYFDSLWHTCGVAMLLGGLLMIIQHRSLLIHAQLCRNLRKQLLERGVPICMECGYDLRGQTSPRCPECGAPSECPTLVQG